jgi:hypothetical protein
MSGGGQDRKAYMREYMRARRKSAKAEAGAAVDALMFTADQLRGVIREEIQAALAPLLERLAQPEPSQVFSVDPIAYWLVDGEPDRQCQSSATRGHRRCVNLGGVIVQATDHRGQLGEFIACDVHKARFKPHLSVIAREAKP